MDRMKTTSFVHEKEAWQSLTQEEKSHTHSDSSPAFLYRGQTGRHFRRWPPEDRPKERLTKHQFEFDSMIPTDYRDVEDAIESSGVASVPDRYGDCASIFRSVLTFACIAEHSQSLSAADNKTVMDWLKDCAAGKHGERFDAPGSVGQHYGFRTGYLDTTSSLKMALWFATRDFATGNYIGSGEAVIYRIKISSLKKCCDDLNKASKHSGRDSLRYVDIRSTPAPLGQRARNQCGWSLIRFECPGLLMALIQDCAIEAFTFPRVGGPCAENNLARDFIAPPGENLLKIFADVQSGNLFSPTRQQYIDEHINNNPACSACLPYRINLTDPRWRNWIF